MKARRLVSLVLTVALLFTGFATPKSAEAAEQQAKKYVCDGFDMEFKVTDEYENMFHADVTVTNTGNETLRDWAFSCEFVHEITNIWNARVLGTQEEFCVIGNYDWNQNIAPGGTASFGFSAKKTDDGKIVFPEAFALVMKEKEVDKSEYAVEFVVYSDWGAGNNGALILKNLTGRRIHNWEISFAYDREIVEIANAVIVSYENGIYTLRNAEYNADLEPYGTVHISFNGGQGTGNEKALGFALTETVFDMTDNRDSDGDGLLDREEKELATDRLNPDTDADGLTDYEEVRITETQPTVYASVVDGVSDGDVDMDEDGLSNRQEIDLGTAPRVADTDADGIVDGDELLIKFNPTDEDTDDDGIIDGDEYIEQLIDESRFAKEVFEDNLAAPAELIVSAKWNANKTIEITEYTGAMKWDERPYIGKVIEVSNVDMNGGKIRFAVDDAYEKKEYNVLDTDTNGLLVCYNDGENTVPLKTTYDEETGSLSAEITGEGYYFVIDAIEWMDTLGIKDALENGTITEDGVPALGSDEQVIVNGLVDIVFVVDTTGSMSSYIRNVRNNITSFAQELEALGLSPAFALVDYRDITVKEPDGHTTYVKTAGDGSVWFKNVEEYKNALGSLRITGGGDNPETVIDGLEMARRLEFRQNSVKCFVVVTDAEYKVHNNYGIESMDEMIELLVADKINVSIVSNSKREALYMPLCEATGGTYAIMSNNFKSDLLDIATNITREVNETYWIALDGFIPQLVMLDEKPTAESIVDTDGDGLLDVVELKSVEPTKYVDVVSFLSALGIPMGDVVIGIPVFEYITNPAQKDA